jgi:hypothetical protein
LVQKGQKAVYNKETLTKIIVIFRLVVSSIGFLLHNVSSHHGVLSNVKNKFLEKIRQKIYEEFRLIACES